MTYYEITYICTGSGEKKRLDHISLRCGEEFKFIRGTETLTNISDAIEIFEKIATEWWRTYETRNAITNIKVYEV